LGDAASWWRLFAGTPVVAVTQSGGQPAAAAQTGLQVTRITVVTTFSAAEIQLQPAHADLLVPKSVERIMSNYCGRRAVVVGGGIGGLSAAGALAGYFEQVYVLERDRLATYPESRPGTAQDRHPYGLLAGGLEALGEIFPGFEQDLAEAGAVPVGVAQDIRYERADVGVLPRRDFGLSILCYLRHLSFSSAAFRVPRKGVTAGLGRARSWAPRSGGLPVLIGPLSPSNSRAVHPHSTHQGVHQ